MGNKNFNLKNEFEKSFIENEIKDSSRLKQKNFSGDNYIGELKRDKKHGFGLLEKKDGTKYKGYFFDDKFDGEGKILYKDNSVYIGFWKEGKLHGEGILYYKDKKINLNYINGKRVDTSLVNQITPNFN